jgi:PBP1b-binding outer membrane lipoprotein LpoB
MKFIKNAIFALVISVLLVGCESKQIEVATVPIQRQSIILPEVQPLKLNSIKWVVVTEENFTEILDNLDKNNNQRVLFSLSDQDYENISINFARITGHIIQLNNIINSYDDYYQTQLDKEGKNVESSRP